jgi:hypothetical protein
MLGCFHSNYYEYVFWVVIPCSLEKFQRNILPPFSGSKSKQSNFHSAYYMLHAGILFAYSLTLKTEVTCSSEMLVDSQWITQAYIPEETRHEQF